MMFVAALLLCLVAASRQAIPSPCPEILEYEDDVLYPDRQYGKVTIPPGINWQYMYIYLDQQAYLETWKGGVSTEDYRRFCIHNPWKQVSSEPLRFFINYDAENSGVPRVQQIQLEEREICNVNQPVTLAPAKVVAPLKTVVEDVTLTAIQSPTPATSNGSNVMLLNYTAFLQNGKCGEQKLFQPQYLVVNGFPTLEGEHPWQVAIYRTKGAGNSYICGGTLVSHRHVITAAHCSVNRSRKPVRTVDHRSLTVFLGKHNLRTSVDGVQIVFVSKITVHPDFDPMSLARDLSVLTLMKPVEYTAWVQPACLWPDQFIDLNNIIGKRGSVVGWGSDNSGNLLRVDMPVVSQETCIRSKGDFFLRVTSEYTYCAGLRNGTSPCNGDSGGGMLFSMGRSWYLRGVVSIALSKENEAVCDPLHYTVFTDLAKFLPWIRENVEPY